MQQEVQQKTEQLEAQLSASDAVSEKLSLLNELAWHLRQVNIEKSRTYASEALELAEKENDLFNKASALRALGSAEDFANRPQQALNYLREAARIFKSLDKPEQVIATNNLIGKMLIYLSDLPNALDIFQQNEKIALQSGNERWRADSLLTMGVVLLRNNDFSKAEKLLLESLDICRKTGFDAGEGRALLNLSALYIDTNRLEEGLEAARAACPIFEKRGDSVDLASSLSNAATALQALGRYEEAEAGFLRTREMREKNNERLHLVNNCISLAELYTMQKRYDEAIHELDNAIEMAGKAENIFQLKHAHKAYYVLYEAQHLFEKALEHYKKFHEYEQLVSSHERQQQLHQLQVRAEVEKLENEKEFYRKHNVELEDANQQISRQKSLIEEKNKDITDSIQYARRIQEAMLPSQEELQRLLPGCFVFYRPKDIVSGDFYWATEKDGQVFFVVADCTGHGVPGALMSMIGHNLLHRIVGEMGLTDPGKILSRLDYDLRFLLKQNSADSGGNDGMDILFCSVNREKNNVHFSGSRRPLWHFRNGTLTEYKGERDYVGGKGEGFRQFATQTINCETGDLFCLFSDGFADQFGGPEKKKYQTGRFRKFLLELSAKNEGSEAAQLEKEFLGWKGDNEQVDDILVAGIRF